MERSQYIEKAKTLRKGMSVAEILETENGPRTGRVEEFKSINAAKKRIRERTKGDAKHIAVCLHANEWFPARTVSA